MPDNCYEYELTTEEGGSGYVWSGLIPQKGGAVDVSSCLISKKGGAVYVWSGLVPNKGGKVWPCLGWRRWRLGREELSMSLPWWSSWNCALK